MISTKFYFIIFIVLSFQSAAFSQERKKNSNDLPKTDINKNFSKPADTIEFKYYSRIKELDNRIKIVTDSIKYFLDSVINSNIKNFSDQQRDSLKLSAVRINKDLIKLINSQKNTLGVSLNNYKSSIRKIKNAKHVPNFNLSEAIDSLQSEIADTLEEMNSDFDEILSDSLDIMLEILTDIADGFSDEDKASFTIGTDISSSFSYKGRKPKVNQAGFQPSFTYTHPWGLFIELNALWLSKQPVKKTEIDIGLGYSYDLTDDLSASLTYTRLFYKDSSAKYSKTLYGSNSKLKVPNNPNNILALDLDYDLSDIMSINFSSSYYFGQSTDYDFALNLWRSLETGNILSNIKLDFTPRFSMTYGMLYDTKTEVKTFGSKSTLNINKTIRGLAVFDYEFKLTAGIHISDLEISFSYSLDYPVNSLKNESGKNFSSFGLGILYSF